MQQVTLGLPLGLALAQRAVLISQDQKFASRLLQSTCQSDLGRVTEPQINPEAPPV